MIFANPEIKQYLRFRSGLKDKWETFFSSNSTQTTILRPSSDILESRSKSRKMIMGKLNQWSGLI